MAKPLHLAGGEIIRSDAAEQMVWGYAITTEKSGDGQTVTRGAIEAAVAEWIEFGNVREMHQPSAVGKVVEHSVDDRGLYLGVHVVDPDAWMKVDGEVYKAFSVRAKVTARDGLDRSVVTGIKIIEVSLVDHPDDYGCKFDVWRSADAGDFNETDDEPAHAADEEEDMSRAAARQAAADPAHAEPQPDAAADVERAADAAGPPADAEAAPPGDAEAGAGAPAADGAGEGADEAQRGADGAPAADEPAPEADAVADAVAGATAAMGALDEALARASGDPAPAVDVAALPGAEVRRSLGLVNRLGYVLNELVYVIYEADYEREVEGDDSPVPAQLREALRGLAVAYKAMSAEEVEELLANVDPEVAVTRGLIALTSGADILERGADAEVSPELAGRLQTLFDAAITRGWAPVLAPADEPDELQRRVDALSTDRDTLLRSVADMTTKMTEMTETISRLSETVLPPRTGGSLARAVTKEEDAAGAGAGAAPDGAPALNHHRHRPRRLRPAGSGEEPLSGRHADPQSASAPRRRRHRHGHQLEAGQRHHRLRLRRDPLGAGRPARRQMSYTTANKAASYVHDRRRRRATFEAINAGRTFEDVQARMTMRLLQKTMLKEEMASSAATTRCSSARRAPTLSASAPAPRCRRSPIR
jgi:hypothetical protein